MRALPKFIGMIALSLACVAGVQAQAQGQFSPVLMVNDRAITGFEIDQRVRLLTLFRTPGATAELARAQLIEDRLKQDEMDRAGLSLSEADIRTAMEEFAGRANLSLDQFLQLLGQNGVEEATLRDFVTVGIAWRDFIRGRFNSRAVVSDADVNRALGQAQGSATGIEVLLSEIIIPAPPPRAAQALAQAQQIATYRNASQFEAAARQLSALPSRNNGGRLGWLPIANYPPALRSLILDLGTGEVTAPIQIPNGVALFQMRGVREVAQAAPPPASIAYAAYLISGGADAGRVAAASLAEQVDTCDDLYGTAKGQPAEVLERQDLAPGDIPQDIALELARLDPGEVSYNLTRDDGNTVMFIMLCGRTAATEGEVDREGIRNQLRSQRLAGFADALLEDLRAAATITTQ